MRHVFFFVNGLLNNPASANGWTDDSATWFLQRGHAAEKFEYFAGAIFRRLFQWWRARQLAERVNRYGIGWRVHLVGHSNGTDIICRALPHMRTVETVHLISAACEADFRRNGLADALERRKVERVFVYLAGQDRPLRWARLTRFLRCIGLGYGTMGLTGPVNGTACVTVEPTFGHSSWFDAEHFDATMQRIEEGAIDG